MMNHSEQGQRMPDNSNGHSIGSPRPQQSQQNGAGGAPGELYPPVAGGAHRPAMMNRAEKFEDEKRRIIESCFSKRDADGSCQKSLPSLEPKYIVDVCGLMQPSDSQRVLYYPHPNH